jgi:hypothetical protein
MKKVLWVIGFGAAGVLLVVLGGEKSKKVSEPSDDPFEATELQGTPL